MIGLFYFLLTLACGASACLLVAPAFSRVFTARPLLPGKASPRAWMFWVPAAFVVGTMLTAWVAYLGAYLFSGTGKPMLWGAVIAALFSLVLCAAAIWFRRTAVAELLRAFRRKGVRAAISENRRELLFCLLVSVFWLVLIVRSLYVSDGELRVGFSVFSDFCPHLSVIRSFSEGGNIPTQYPHFADGTIRYHFMFQFAVGMLEYLGMRIDIAFNLLSLCSILGMMMLFWVLTVQITGSRLVAALSAAFFTFRSSFAIFTYFAGAEEGILAAIRALFTSTEHIGNTQSESWGLWTQKVYLNQRHLPIGFAVAFLAIICFYPLLVHMVDSLRALSAGKDRKKLSSAERRRAWWRVFVFSRDAWLPEGILMPICLGLLLGMLGFFNGAVLIASLSVLFVMAILSRHRLSYLISAVIAVVMVLLESKLFVPTGGGVVSPQITVGFLAESAALSDIVAYLIELLGVLPFVILIFVPSMPKGLRWLTLAFTAPIIVAELLQLTPDITVNHKYIMLGCALLDIMAAAGIGLLLRRKKLLLRCAALVLICLMTLTGLADLITQWSLDRYTVKYDEADPLKTFVAESTAEGSVFLTDTTYSLGEILLAGRMLYCGWPYFAWSAGYDTNGRTQKTAEIYGAQDAETLRRLLAEEGIDYVYIDDANRSSEDYQLNEKLIDATLQMVYHDAETRTYVYAVDPS